MCRSLVPRGHNRGQYLSSACVGIRLGNMAPTKEKAQLTEFLRYGAASYILEGQIIRICPNL